ncbi:MAG: sensory rhodopsin transducer [Cyclobacteriaceae bacterium]
MSLLEAKMKNGQIKIYIYFSDKEPVGPYQVSVADRKTLHLRFKQLDDPKPIPKGTGFGVTFISTVPVVVAHIRFDSWQAENGLMTYYGFSR